MKLQAVPMLKETHKEQIVALWNEGYPVKLSHEKVTDFEAYLDDLENIHHHLLLDITGGVRGWLAHFIRDGERWFTILVDPACQGKGWGTLLLDRAKAECTQLNGWIVENDVERKRNGEIYRAPIRFYKRHGFQIDQNSRTSKHDIHFIKICWSPEGQEPAQLFCNHR